MMKNGSAWKVTICAATILFGMLAFILGGWRGDMANAQRERVSIGEEVVRQGNRITTLETRYERIDKSLDRIEELLGEKK